MAVKRECEHCGGVAYWQTLCPECSSATSDFMAAVRGTVTRDADTAEVSRALRELVARIKPNPRVGHPDRLENP